MKLTIVILLARFARALLRLLGTGASSFPGKLACRLMPDILSRLSRGVKIIAVTGTNGKTTVCAMIKKAIEDSGKSCVSNSTGANMLSGVVGAFLDCSDIRGRCKSDYAVLECDENALRQISRHISADILVVTNIFRDQLDRYGEVSSTLAAVKTGARNMPGALLVLNADDPVSFSLSRSASRFVSFGIDADLEPSGGGESEFCPFCGAKYEYSFRTYSQLGGFCCPSCGYSRQEPEYAACGIVSLEPDCSQAFASFRGKNMLVTARPGGVYNIYNALSAAAALSEAGFPANGVLRSLAGFSGAFGRAERFGSARLLLVKNPAGLTQASAQLSRFGVKNIIFVLNDNDADGRDVSWIWDADISLPRSAKNICTFGLRSGDMALRLKYSGVDAHIIKNVSEFKSVVRSGSTAVVATYTAMLALRPVLSGKEFWQ